MPFAVPPKPLQGATDSSTQYPDSTPFSGPGPRAKAKARVQSPKASKARTPSAHIYGKRPAKRY